MIVQVALPIRRAPRRPAVRSHPPSGAPSPVQSACSWVRTGTGAALVKVTRSVQLAELPGQLPDPLVDPDLVGGAVGDVQADVGQVVRTGDGRHEPRPARGLQPEQPVRLGRRNEVAGLRGRHLHRPDALHARRRQVGERRAAALVEPPLQLSGQRGRRQHRTQVDPERGRRRLDPSVGVPPGQVLVLAQGGPVVLRGAQVGGAVDHQHRRRLAVVVDRAGRRPATGDLEVDVDAVQARDGDHPAVVHRPRAGQIQQGEVGRAARGDGRRRVERALPGHHPGAAWADERHRGDRGGDGDQPATAWRPPATPPQHRQDTSRPASAGDAMREQRPGWIGMCPPSVTGQSSR